MSATWRSSARPSVGADSVFHLAAVVSGAAEADFDLGMRVNLDGTRALLEALRGEGRRPKVVFSSSVAVFGGALPAMVDDATTPMPQSSYGVQKLIGELLVGDYSRKGYVDGRAVRLPTIVVRPGKPNAAASSFASGIIREPLAGVEAVCPVDPDTAMWVLSPTAAITNLLHAHELPAERWTGPRSLSLPGITVVGARDARGAGGGGRRGGACARAHAAGPAHRGHRAHLARPLRHGTRGCHGLRARRRLRIGRPRIREGVRAVTMKKTELEKRKGLKLANDLRLAGNPYARSGETEADRRARRDRDRALGLVPFAAKLPQELVRQMQAEAEARGARLDDLVAEWLRKGMAG